MIDDLYPIPRLPYDATKDEMKRVPRGEFSVDIHELFVDEALMYLRKLVKNAPKSITRIRVVHGYNSGQALKGALTVKNLQSKKVKSIFRTINKGESVIIFKEVS